MEAKAGIDYATAVDEGDVDVVLGMRVRSARRAVCDTGRIASDG